MANPQIGTCPCPFKNCNETMAVKRFATRTDDPRHQRKGGKLYADCLVHGRIGNDASRATQEYLLEKSDLWAPDEIETQRTAAAAADLERKRAAILQRPAPASTSSAPAVKTAKTTAPTSSSSAPKKPENSMW